jgi:hypothetical protein
MQSETNGAATQRGTENQGTGVQRRGDIEPDVLRIPTVLTSVIDRLLQDEQRRTCESTASIRRRYKQEQLDALAEWAAKKQAQLARCEGGS